MCWPRRTACSGRAAGSCASSSRASSCRVLERAYEAYSFTVLPLLGRFVAGDADSYRYLAESIRRFPDQEAFARLIAGAGFGQVRHRNLSGGIAAIHSGWRL